MANGINQLKLRPRKPIRRYDEATQRDGMVDDDDDDDDDNDDDDDDDDDDDVGVVAGGSFSRC